MTVTEVAPPALDSETAELYTHIVRGDPTTAMVYGTPMQALCGKQWVPSRDPDRFPLCPTCEAECRRHTGCAAALDAKAIR